MLKRVFLLAVFLVFLQLPRVKAQPEQDTTWDFGRIKFGEVAKHVFVYKNDSPVDLNIKGTNASCGCTVSKVDKQKLAPGEEANLEVAFNSLGYSGEVQQFVYMNTDSRDNPVVKFTVKADVKK